MRISDWFTRKGWEEQATVEIENIHQSRWLNDTSAGWLWRQTDLRCPRLPHHCVQPGFWCAAYFMISHLPSPHVPPIWQIFFHMLYFGIASNLVLQSRNSLILRLPDGCSKNTSTASAECVHIPSYVGTLIQKDWHFRAVAKLESLSHFGCLPSLKPSSLYYLIHI